MCHVQIRYFASLREDLGCDSEELEISGSVTQARILASLAERHPSHAALLLGSRIAVEDAFVVPGECVAMGSEVSIIPPVSGG